jgi:hypothetical protein
MTTSQAKFWIVVWLITGVAVAISICFYAPYNQSHTIAYDCRLAEISVDYPQQVKEQCRRLMK